MAAGDSMKLFVSKTVNQAQMTADCWNIQIWGLSACERCGLQGADECGGKEIRAALLEHGSYGPVGIDGLPNQEEV